jgi:hypothetical protein
MSLAVTSVSFSFVFLGFAMDDLVGEALMYTIMITLVLVTGAVFWVHVARSRREARAEAADPPPGT